MSGRRRAGHFVRPVRSKVRDGDIDTSEDERQMEDGDASTKQKAVKEPEEAKDDEEDVECRECGGETEEVKIIRDPGTPTPAQRAAHEATHYPFRSWCGPCVKGRATGQAHRSLGEKATSTITRVGMDYGFIQEEQMVEKDEENGQKELVKFIMTILVMTETLCDSVWSYALEGKGAVSTDWIAPKMVEDMNTMGLKQERIITKSDQEPSIVQVQHEIAKLRTESGTAIENSRVGESDSNGKVERAIREVKGMVRTLRSHIEEKTGKAVKLDDPIVPWIVRHAGYLVTRCRIGPDGKTALQKMKGTRMNVGVLPLAEAVLFKMPRKDGDFSDRFGTGVWLGCTIRSGEHLIGTERGVFTVSSVNRCPEDKRWSIDLIKGLKGTPREPVPGSGTSKVHAYAKPVEEESKSTPTFAPRRTADDEPEVRVNYIYKKDVEKFGATEGCQGCRALMTPGSKFRAKHTSACRARIEEELNKTEAGQKRVQRANDRMNQAVVEKSEQIMEEQEKKRKLEEADNKASGSGLNEERRAAELKEQTDAEMKAEGDARDGKKVANDASMEDGDFGPHGDKAPMSPPPVPRQERTNEDMEVTDEQGLEAAPPRGTDVRVPLAERRPAEKREREEATPPRAKKWQTYEPAASTVDADGQHYDEVMARYPKPNGGDIHTTDNRIHTIDRHEDREAAKEAAKEHPGPKIRREDVEKEDLQWKDIGSGTVARTFLGLKKLLITTRGGPAECDIHRRTVWSLRTGKIIDDCYVDDVPERILRRELEHEDDVRIELVLKDALALYERKGADVVEIFSVPRIAQEAGTRRHDGTKLVPGWSLDLTRTDPKTGKQWDLANKTVQSRVKKMIRDSKPLFVIGSPPCTAFSSLQHFNAKKRDPKVVAEEKAKAEGHIKFCIEVYMMQIEGRRYFVHEHPAGAKCWELKGMMELMAAEGTDSVTVDMCQFGMTATKQGKDGPVQKKTRIVSNSAEVLKRVAVKCPNQGGHGEPHTHISLEGGLAKQAQVYPRKFCQAVCEGIAAQKKLDALGLEAKRLMSRDEMAGVLDSLGLDGSKEDPSEALHEEELRIAFDDQSGEPLRPDMVRRARREEIEYFKERKVYEKVTIDECWRTTGAGPIGVKWVDINKGDTKCPNYRSRLVAMEFKTDERPEWYAATPPSECLKIALSMMAEDRKKKMLYADVSRAYFYAKAARPVYVKLPEEDREPGDESMCGRLRVSMYGTRDAALNWATEYGETLKDAGYRQGTTNPCLFRNDEKDVTIIVHGDDFVAIGSAEHLVETEEALKEKYKIKVEKLGSDKTDAKEVRVLNKVIRCTDAGIELEADPRHAELVVRELGLESSRTSKTPGVKEDVRSVKKEFTAVKTVKGEMKHGVRTRGGKVVEVASVEKHEKERNMPPWMLALSEEKEEEQEDDPLMGKDDARTFRAVVARLNYMASDRPDIQFAVKEVARNMSAPRAAHWQAVRRIGTYVKGRPRLVLKYQWQRPVRTAVTFTDSDWAGCRKTAKSTSGGVVTIGGHLIKSYSRQQKTVALSSAEAELHAMVAASAETLGIMGLCKDMGMSLSGEVFADSSAALGIAQRTGTGKVRHLRVQALWVQEVRTTGRLRYKKVLGSRNPADILTKHVPAELLSAHLRTLGVDVRDGRAESAPTLDSVEAITLAWKNEDELEPEEMKEVNRAKRKVKFSPRVEVRKIPASGEGKPTKTAKRTKMVREGKSAGGVAECALATWASKNCSCSRSEKISWADATDDEDGQGEQKKVARRPEVNRRARHQP